MTPFQTRQRGEGKLGCIVSLAVAAAIVAAVYKALPVYYSDHELVDALKDIGPKASGITNPEAVEAMVRAKAKELEIQEVLTDPNAVKVTLVPSAGEAPGKCTIRLNYKRTVDFYGFYQYTFVTNETADSTIYTNIR
jgi:hypothetical protein